MIKVLIVDSSRSDAEWLAELLHKDPQLIVEGRAGSVQAALKMVRAHKPHVIALNLHMQGLDPIDAIGQIMASVPTPIVVIAGNSSKEVESGFDALAAGALTVERRPFDESHPEHAESSARFVQTLKAMAEVRVVRRWQLARTAREHPRETRERPRENSHRIKIVALGASTGGPTALRDVLAQLPREFPLPILIVQHMAHGFMGDFVDWLTTASGFPVSLAKNRENLLPGKAYIAPDGMQMGLANQHTISLIQTSPEHGMCPAVSFLFRSVCKHFGGNSAAILLSGMGKDGATELKALRTAGAITIVQDKESSVVYGMPGEAIRLDAAQLILKPNEIGRAIKLIPSLNDRNLPEALIMGGEQ